MARDARLEDQKGAFVLLQLNDGCIVHGDEWLRGEVAIVRREDEAARGDSLMQRDVTTKAGGLTEEIFRYIERHAAKTLGCRL